MTTRYYEENGFQCRDGKAFAKGFFCTKKLCIVATDKAYLVSVLDEACERDDCFFVKYSPNAKDGMHLGRIFLTNPLEIGALWKKLKADPKLMCSVQDDDFTRVFR